MGDFKPVGKGMVVAEEVQIFPHCFRAVNIFQIQSDSPFLLKMFASLVLSRKSGHRPCAVSSMTSNCFLKGNKAPATFLVKKVNLRGFGRRFLLESKNEHFKAAIQAWAVEHFRPRP